MLPFLYTLVSNHYRNILLSIFLSDLPKRHRQDYFVHKLNFQKRRKKTGNIFFSIMSGALLLKVQLYTTLFSLFRID